jgi:hypothetical protein
MHTARFIPLFAYETLKNITGTAERLNLINRSALLDNTVKSVTKLLRKAILYVHAAKDLVYF